MSFLARRIKKVAYWPCDKNSYSDMSAISADAVTNDLTTKNNEISWWRIESVDEAEQVGLSFISKLDKGQSGVINIVMIPFDEVSNKLSLKHTPEHGDTAIKDMETTHYDICNLNYEKLGVLGDIVAKSTSHESHMFIATFKIKQLFEKLEQYKLAGKLNVAELGEYAASKLGA